MKQLTENEIKFIKETKWSPTIFQMGYSDLELCRTPYKGSSSEEGIKEFQKEADKLGVDILTLYNKCTSETDSISLEYEATYLLYLFFTKEELEKLTNNTVLKWLQYFQYYQGYRKWHYENMQYVQEALEIYEGTRVFYLEDDGEVWNISKEESPNSWVWSKPERILKI